MMESASNLHWFGPGRFTDHSTLDVVPALLAGLVLLVLCLALRVRSELAAARSSRFFRDCDNALGDASVRLLPIAFALQILVLYLMESCEQVTVWGHLAGGTIWLGGPVLVSLCVHAVTCALVGALAARVVKVMARTTLQVLRIIRAWFTRPARPSRTPARRARETVAFARFFRVCSGVGERAPPLLQV